MIVATAQGITQFISNPVEALSNMRAAAPGLQASILALSALTLIMVVIDMAYGPYAFPHSVQPGGKRDLAVLTMAFIEMARAFAYASVVLLGTRFLLKNQVSVADAIWMTVPFALALVVFELVQMGAWLFMIYTGINFYGQLFIMGFLGAILVLTVSIRVLAHDKDWLGVLPVVVGTFLLGYYLALVVLGVTAFYLLVRKLR